MSTMNPSAMASTAATTAMSQKLLTTPLVLPARLLPRHLHQDLQSAVAMMALISAMPKPLLMPGLQVALMTG
jgi:hypothetical protein